MGLRDCVVFGVEIPGTEGRAGMAVIPDPERLVDLATLYSGVTEKLPSYARPMFVRFVKELISTGFHLYYRCYLAIMIFLGTHKLKKVDLQKEGFNVEKILDEVFMLDSKTKSYEKLDKETYNNILNGNVRF